MALPIILRVVRPWAKDGYRQTPESVGLNRDTGWPVSYEQVGNKGPERGVVSQLLFEITSYIYYRLRYGIMQWDDSLNYRSRALVAENNTLYRSKTATGPATGNATRPSTDTAAVAWEVY